MSLCLTLLALLVFPASAAQPAAREYDVKATLLFNFTQFVEWPASTLTEDKGPFVIGILGTDPFGKFLDDLVKNERVHGKPIEVRRFRKPEEASKAHILFVSKSEQSRLDSIIAVLKDKPVLTVGDAGERDFAWRGGVVALIKEKDKIGLGVNLDAASLAGLTINAKLLQVAEILRGGKQ
jgi:hypothetical protein